MCCFSRPAQVSNTNIFARTADDQHQYLAYQMTVQAKEDLAMVLPLPVPPRSPEGALRFINLDTYPDFFFDVAQGVFPPPMTKGGGSRSMGDPSGHLRVVDVGSFQASFVPTVADFSRLDERFRLPAGTWQKLPQYADWGFAVFKLKPGKKTLHPMVFDFPRRNPRELFFPTVHIHDGLVHAEADFDHALYCQARTAEKFPLREWTESVQPAQSFVKEELARELINPSKHIYGLRLKGELKNEDTVLVY